MTYSFRTNGNFIDFVHTDNTSLQVENVLKSLHNTSVCVFWILPSDTTRIGFTVDGDRFDNVPITEIDFDGVAMDSQDDFETNIVAMFPGLAHDTPTTLVYTAKIWQSGSGLADPSVTVLENTIGEIVWTRIGVGGYRGTLTGAFASFAGNKVWTFPGGMGGNAVAGYGNSVPFDTAYSLNCLNADYVSLNSYEAATYNGVELFTYVPVNEPMQIEIRIYP